MSQHLKVLLDADLVLMRPSGARRLYSVDRGGLERVRAWVTGFWDEVLDAYVEQAHVTGGPDMTIRMTGMTSPVVRSAHVRRRSHRAAWS